MKGVNRALTGRHTISLLHINPQTTAMAAALFLSALLFSDFGVSHPGSPYDQQLLSDGKWDFDVSVYPRCSRCDLMCN